MLKVIAFDVFGTVFDMSYVPRDEVRAYLGHVTQNPWTPLKLPGSWDELPAHKDSAEGLSLLRKNFKVVTCSNGPLRTLRKASDHNNIVWDAIVALEANRVFKPHPKAYLTVCEVMGVAPDEVMMVTANRAFAHYGFGDIEIAKAIGMQATLIRTESCPTIISLAKMLGC